MLDRDKQLVAVSQLTEVIAKAAGDDGLLQRTWVMLTEAEAEADGWGLWGRAHNNDELADVARAQIAELQAKAAQA